MHFFLRDVFGRRFSVQAPSLKEQIGSVGEERNRKGRLPPSCNPIVKIPLETKGGGEVPNGRRTVVDGIPLCVFFD